MLKKISEYLEDDFIKAGYRKYNSELKRCNYFYQKRFTDKLGVRYFIEILVYDFEERENFPAHTGYSAYCAYQNSEPYTLVELSHVEKLTLKEIEDRFNLLWKTIGKPYYSLFEIEKENS